MVNRVILLGRLGRDPEVRYTGGGRAVANFSMATDESFKNKEGERVSKTEWHKIVLWGPQAETAQKYLHKGALIYIEGKIQSREYEKDGVKKTSYEINADIFRMLDKKETAVMAGGGFGGNQDQEVDNSDVPF